MATTREIHLAARPQGAPDRSTFAVAEVPLPVPADGEVLVRNLVMSVDPYMRGRMNATGGYVKPYEIGQPLDGAAVGQVIESRTPDLAEGALVLNQFGWREHFTSAPRGLQQVERDQAPISAHLGVLGMPGFTAWYGLRELGQPKPGELVFVSAASGAVGSLVVQLARTWDCRVIGSVGSGAKLEYLRSELGAEGFDYHETAPREALRTLAPEGIDIYFDNVGGDHLEAALGSMRTFGRIIECGMIAIYNNQAPTPGPRNLALMIGRRLTMRGFLISDHWDRRAEFLAEVGPLVRSGVLKWTETAWDGLEKAPEAFLSLFSGEKLGKVVVRLAPDPG